MLAVAFYLACTGLFLTLSLLGPIFVGLFADEIDVTLRLSFYLLVGSFLFGAPVLAIIGRLRRVPQIGRLMLLFLVWTILPIAAAIPIIDISELGVIDSLFESFSGFTTTGSTTLNTVENWPQAMLFWRVQLQWFGGFLALLTIILILAPLGIGGLSRNKVSFISSLDFQTAQGRVWYFLLKLALLYVTMTIICFVGFFLSGTRAFYAVTLAMTATSTGGFLPFDDSLDQILSPFGQLIFGGFLIVGATSVFWHRMIATADYAGLTRHRESYSVIIVVLILMVMFTFRVYTLAVGQDQAPLEILIEAFMNSASLVATSGVQTQPGYFTLIPMVVIMFVVLAGGSAFSTSGGIKHYRLGGMLVQSWSELDRLIYPSAVRSSHFGSEKFDIELMKAIWSFFVVAIITICLGTVFVATSGLPFEASLAATIATFSTAGPVYSAGWVGVAAEPWPPYSAFSDPAKCVLIVVMILGRLEAIAVIGLFNLRYWRSR